ncbi:L,D-transpeptidase family protein [Sphingomonas abaci]|uniref:Murein L,D-transpeptidase YcbB/YkuD n=1 Tax=Sphingomonas abaci TaxID=237611 RepID=A0A7W7APW5_9SPHN|nr:L,D-transpeptidase family protein [Sphingomonas abaci]MBB4619992.1 murein L,D-transpeptidase YcbB/YkuD [Sphingomonas abaci]
MKKLTSCVLLTSIALTAPALPTMAQTLPGGTTTRPVPPPQWESLWNGANRAALKQALGNRARHGLDHVTFLAGDVDNQPEVEAAKAYTEAAMAYARALAHGMVDPRSLHDVYTIARPATDQTGALADALRQNRLGQWLNGLAPVDPEYRLLSQAYLEASRNDDAQRPVIALTDSIHVGDVDLRVPEIVDQLVSDGYLTTRPSTSPVDLYSQDIADAVKALQRDYGIREDGIIGPNTLRVLTLGPGDRARTLAVALERRRWLSRTPPATRIDVNTAAAELRYYRDGQLVDRRKVIVGEPNRETPPLGSPIYRLVANPTWTVPKSIPVSRATVRAKNMRRVNGYWVQPSGPDNALGLVKFDMRNDQAIYLHDTAAPELFERSQRHLSHGCVRVSDALGFAAMLADQEGVGDAWAKAHASGNYEIVDLPREIPVRLLYHNAFVADDGKVGFRTDPYGWNDAVAVQLGFADAKTRHAQAEAIDIGP